MRNIANINKHIKSKEDAIRFFKQKIEDKRAWAECVRTGRPLSDLESRGIKFAKLNTILK